MVSILLESVAVCVSIQPDLARAILVGDKKMEDWRLFDKIVFCVLITSNMLNDSQDNLGSVVDEKLLDLRCLLTCPCLQVI